MGRCRVRKRQWDSLERSSLLKVNLQRKEEGAEGEASLDDKSDLMDYSYLWETKSSIESGEFLI